MLNCNFVTVYDLDESGEARPAVTRLVHGPWERLPSTPATSAPARSCRGRSATAPRRTAPGCRRVWEAGDGARGSPARRLRRAPHHPGRNGYDLAARFPLAAAARSMPSLRGGAGAALGGQAAYLRRGPPRGGELRQAAGAAAPRSTVIPSSVPKGLSRDLGPGAAESASRGCHAEVNFHMGRQDSPPQLGG
jgi:hypothetical protein